MSENESPLLPPAIDSAPAADPGHTAESAAAVTAAPARVMEPPLGGGTGAPSNGGWVPTLRQVLDAARFKLAAAIGPEPEWPFFTRGLHSSMR